MPFITEEIYHLLKERAAIDDLTVKQYSAYKNIDLKILEEGEMLKKAITSIREFRNKNLLSNKDKIILNISLTAIIIVAMRNLEILRRKFQDILHWVVKSY